MTSALAPAPLPDISRQVGTIEARNFSFWYGKKQALKNISIAVPPRAVTALIGPSGCGKSTFLRSINRLNDLIPGIRHEGEMCLDSRSIFEKGMVKGGPPLFVPDDVTDETEVFVSWLENEFRDLDGGIRRAADRN